ncbi:Cysteine--tRNA ligase [uncultured Gammaproteobacteria bacterium]
MSLVLYNTLSRRKEPFQPQNPQRVGMYVCGPTVYDFAHIGNARPVVVFDTLYRLLRRDYASVTYVRNITDVDDKIIAAAHKNGEPIDALTERTAAAFHADMAALGALAPDIEPRATEHIGQMITMIARLVELGHAYTAEGTADGHVLFHVPSMADYGKLSRHGRDELVAGARIEVAPYKRDAADFVLWKPSSPGQPGWDSPWGRGRPGWHIECSAMAEHHLGPTLDIHGGGLDLIFPHHENEIAQSCCAHQGAPLANVWLHNGFVQVNGEKMAKSAGNFFTVRQLLEEGWPGEVIRLTLLSAHYRQPLDFTREGLRQSRAGLDRWYTALRGIPAELSAVANPAVANHDPALTAVSAALDDDLNTPQAIAVLHEAAARANKAITPADKAAAQAGLRTAAALLGLLGESPEAWFKRPAARAEGESLTATVVDQEIERLIGERLEARKTRNFAEADRIRAYLKDRGVVLEDGAGATSWKRG